MTQLLLIFGLTIAIIVILKIIDHFIEKNISFGAALIIGFILSTLIVEGAKNAAHSAAHPVPVPYHHSSYVQIDPS